jgi:tetratricopeptide (TPR) repeat protein
MLGYYVAEAKLHTEKQGYGEARTSCERALEFSTPLTRPVVFRQLAEIAIKDGSLDDAFDACEEALSINQNSPEALLTLTKVYAALGDSRMTNEIGGRLLVLWKDADADFVQLQTLHQLLSRSIKSAL